MEIELIHRKLEETIKQFINRNKVILIVGTRRVGKTMLAKTIIRNCERNTLVLDGEDIEVQEMLMNRSAANYKRIIGNATLLVVDEAQTIPEIGRILKLMIDTIPDLTILATGSSSFDLMNKTGDPLTGRQIPLHLYPLSQAEISLRENALETAQNLEERLVFGSYPELFQIAGSKEKSLYLRDLAQSYLLKDILSFEGIRRTDKMMRLLRLVAFQCGGELSYTQLATQLGLSKNTVENYLDLLSKVFIVYKLEAYSTNPRKEISKSSKWLFYDNGIRNAFTNDFRLLALRNDIGQLWENYLMTERIKKNDYERKNVQYYFWRNYSGKEIDLIERHDAVLSAYEFKYSPLKKVSKPLSFDNAYPQAQFQVISKDNYLDWIT